MTAAFDMTKAEKRFRTLEEKLNLPSARIGFEQIDMRITNRRGKNHQFAEQTREDSQNSLRKSEYRTV